MFQYPRILTYISDHFYALSTGHSSLWTLFKEKRNLQSLILETLKTQSGTVGYIDLLHVVLIASVSGPITLTVAPVIADTRAELTVMLTCNTQVARLPGISGYSRQSKIRTLDLRVNCRLLTPKTTVSWFLFTS